ncbi:hypothetical protein TNCT_108211 [Trichonephila clavata]|uniref:Uncharacterized protein n=1 Tax=Trichonephila clavata TaxID=2740835 RepID=A0A8X6FQD1_TRICU|nr:hypothetical protein TNCT_108211 [Trichonephila clavata]
MLQSCLARNSKGEAEKKPTRQPVDMAKVGGKTLGGARASTPSAQKELSHWSAEGISGHLPRVGPSKGYRLSRVPREHCLRRVAGLLPADPHLIFSCVSPTPRSGDKASRFEWTEGKIE